MRKLLIFLFIVIFTAEAHALAPRSQFSEPAYVVEEITDTKLLLTIFDFLEEAGMHPGLVEAHQEQCIKNASLYLHRFRVFVVRDKSNGEILCASVIEPNSEKRMLELAYGLGHDIPEPIATMVAFWPSPIAQDLAADSQLMTYIREYFTAMSHSTLAYPLERQNVKEWMLSQGFHAVDASPRTRLLLQSLAIPTLMPGAPLVQAEAYDVDEISDPNDMRSIFSLLLASGTSFNVLEPAMTDFNSDAQRFMKKTQAFVARGKTSGQMLGAIVVNTNFSKHGLDRFLKRRTTYPESISYILEMGVLKEFHERRIEIENVLLEKAENVLRQNGTGTIIAWDTRGSMTSLPSQGYEAAPQVPGFFIKVVPKAIDDGFYSETDPFAIRELVVTRPDIRAKINPPEGALDGLLKKMNKKPRKAAEALMNAIPGIENHFPGLKNPGAAIRPATPVRPASSPKKRSEKEEGLERFREIYRNMLASYAEGPYYFAGDVHEPDIRVFELYCLSKLLAEESSKLREAVLSYLVKSGEIKPEEKEGVFKAAIQPPQECLETLSRAVPTATSEGSQNAIINWLKWIWDNGNYQVDTAKEFLRVLDEGKMQYTFNGVRIPFAVAIVLHKGTAGISLDGVWRSQHRYDIFTSPIAVKAAELDIRTAIEGLLRDGEVGAGNANYVEALISTFDAPEILKHIHFPDENATLLEIGGSGVILKEVNLAQRKRSAGSGMRFIAVEIDPTVAADAADRRKSEGLTNFEVHAADARNLNFLADGSVDAVFAQGLLGDLHHRRAYDEMVPLFTEIDRVLHKDGFLHLVDDGNTPLISYRLLAAAGYEVVTKEIIEEVREYGDYLLLSLRKTKDHAFVQAALNSFSFDTIPEPLWAGDSDPSVHAIQEDRIKDQWTHIPRTVTQPRVLNPQENLGGMVSFEAAL